jgi:hypothetical protein
MMAVGEATYSYVARAGFEFVGRQLVQRKAIGRSVIVEVAEPVAYLGCQIRMQFAGSFDSSSCSAKDPEMNSRWNGAVREETQVIHRQFVACLNRPFIRLRLEGTGRSRTYLKGFKDPP